MLYIVIYCLRPVNGTTRYYLYNIRYMLPTRDIKKKKTFAISKKKTTHKTDSINLLRNNEILKSININRDRYG